MNKYITYICFFLNILSIYSQSEKDTLNLNIRLKYENQSIVSEQKYLSTQKDSLSFDLIKFYLSNFEIYYKDSSVQKEENSYHLVDFEDEESLKIKLKKEANKKIEYLKFNIGVDSLASVSGAMGGDLDAIKGMYWSWQSGFINMKIEGTSPSCKTRNNAFKFHVGGYLSPNYAMKTMKIKIPNDSNAFNLNVDLSKFFSEIKLEETNSILIPGKDAMNLAKISKLFFSIE